MRERLKVAANGNQTAWARTHGLAQAYVSQVATGRKKPGPTILAALGLELVAEYREVGR